MSSRGLDDRCSHGKTVRHLGLSFQEPQPIFHKTTSNWSCKTIFLGKAQLERVAISPILLDIPTPQSLFHQVGPLCSERIIVSCTNLIVNPSEQKLLSVGGVGPWPGPDGTGDGGLRPSPSLRLGPPPALRRIDFGPEVSNWGVGIGFGTQTSWLLTGKDMLRSEQTPLAA